MPEHSDIIIIGAGICGLVAARELLDAGKTVRILEARDRCGGRINSIGEPFASYADSGAEFMHGKLPLTRALIKASGGDFFRKRGRIYHSRKGLVSKESGFIPDERRLMKMLAQVKEDLPLSAFLDRYLRSEEDKELREAVIRAAEGFDAADIKRVSTLSLREEWSGEAMEKAFLLTEGYGRVVDFLSSECMKKGATIHLSSEVVEVAWSAGQVKIKRLDQTRFSAEKVLITVPLGVLRAAPGQMGYIHFDPPIPEKILAAKQIGYGPVIKITFQFKSAFWNNKAYAAQCLQFPRLGFLANDTEIPMWWTRRTGDPLLTGWVGGSAADALQQRSNTELFETALHSLSTLFECSGDFLKEELEAHHIGNWGREPFTLGAYSYPTPETAEAQKILRQPVERTIYFGGEALGEDMSTVESAIDSGLKVAGEIRRAGPARREEKLSEGSPARKKTVA
jgi:monoamine oxidase